MANRKDKRLLGKTNINSTLAPIDKQWHLNVFDEDTYLYTVKNENKEVLKNYAEDNGIKNITTYVI